MSTKKSKSYNGTTFYIQAYRITEEYQEFDTLKDIMITAKDGGYDDETAFYEVEIIRKVKFSSNPFLVEVK